MSRLGVMGGTFDPIHRGHLAAAHAAIRCGRLDGVILVPAAVPPHKGEPVASPDDRLAMCRLAVADDPQLSVADLELERGGPSYSADTLAELRSRLPGDDLFLILGWDAARELPSWRRPQEVLRLATPLILRRPTLPAPSPADLEQAGIEPGAAILCSDRTPDIRATDIRRRAAAGDSLQDEVPPAVARYISERGLYRSGLAGAGRA